MKKWFLSFWFIAFLSFTSWLHPEDLRHAEIVIPARLPVYLVVKGTFESKEKAQETLKFIKQLMGSVPADGIIASDQLKDFPAGKWLIASVFDSEKKAQWWLDFSYRNPTLPKSKIVKTELLEETLAIPYFPDAVREGVKRFYTEEEVLRAIQAFPDIGRLKQETKVKYLFTRYPRTGDYSYEVEVLKENDASQFVMHDFISMSAVNLKSYARYSEAVQKSIEKRP